MKKEGDITLQGHRVKQAHALTKLTRNDFCKRNGIATSTWNTYINDSGRPLSANAANTIVEALAKSDIICSAEWLLTGNGAGPIKRHHLQHLIIDSQDDQSEVIIAEEIRAFQMRYDHCAILKIHDTSMSPFLEPGDYVGGAWREGDVIKLYDKKLCLVKLSQDKIVCRQLNITSTVEGIQGNLVPTNPYASTKPLFVEDIEIKTIARVTRIWKASVLKDI